MNHACVAAKIGDGKALDAGKRPFIAKSSNALQKCLDEELACC